MSIEVTIEKLVYGGEGLARTPEGIVLIPGALPAEQVKIELEPAKRGVRRARLLEIMTPSPFRIAAPCPYFASCGGCHHQQTGYEQQLEWKRAILAECFERIGKLKIAAPINTIAAEPWGYRNRIRLHARKEGGTLAVGFQKPASNELCRVEDCAISAPALQETIQRLAAGELTDAFPTGAFEIELFASDNDRELLATITSGCPAPEHFGEAWQHLQPAYSSVSWIYQTVPATGGPNARLYAPPRRTAWGGGGLTVRVDDFHYRVSHESFFQTNRFLLGKMIETAVGSLEGERALDLFAGVGFFTLPLARRFTHVIAVESHPAAAQDLQTNAGVAASKIYVYPSTTESFLSSKPSRQPWDLIVVDPPRNGLSTPVREAVVALKPKHVVYVSCDPTTLARDLAVLQTGGYNIASIDLIDLFPQTYHLEAIVHLSR